MILPAIIFFIFGSIVGSFLNVLVLRYNTGRSFVAGRSQCFSCGKKLHPYELVPLVSFLILGGRCANCKSKISRQYPLVEFASGALSALVFLTHGLSFFSILYLIAVYTLIAITVYDAKHKIIPDGFVFFFDMLALFGLFAADHFHISAIPLSALFAGPALFSFFAFFWLVSSGRWMGLGDAKLALGVGWFLGLSLGTSAIMLAFWIGALVSVGILLLQKLNISRFGLTIQSEVPFAPFIIAAFLLELFTSWNLFVILHIIQ